MVQIGVASIGERAESLKDTVASLQDQGNVTTFTDMEQGDAAKFIALDGFEGYYLSCDDDLIYPPDYVDTMIAAVEDYGRQAVITLHGSNVVGLCRDYFGKRKMVAHCLKDLAADVRVNIGGTGVMCFHTDTIKFGYKGLKVPNVADIWVGVFAQKQNVPIVAIRHSEGWLKHSEKVNPKRTLFHKYHMSSQYPGNKVLMKVKNWGFPPLSVEVP